MKKKSKFKGRKPAGAEDSKARNSQRESKEPDQRDIKEGNSEDRKHNRTYGLNDMSWYSHYPELVDGVARIPFPYYPGMQIGLGGSSNPKYDIPGVLALHWIPSVGYSVNNTSPISQVARDLYAKVRSEFSGAIRCEAPDIVIYLMAIDSIFSYIGALKRLYRVLDAYSPVNYETPDALLNAMGLAGNLPALRASKDELYFNINQLVRMSQKFIVPDVMDVYNRHYWLNDNVYTDAESMNSQFYLFSQLGYYKFAMIEDSAGVEVGGLSLVQSPFYTSGVTVDQLYTFGETLMNSLAAWPEAYEVTGYLMGAFKESSAFMVDLLDLHDPLTPVFVPEVLAQIENADCIMGGLSGAPAINFLTNTDITQQVSTNSIISNVQLRSNFTNVTAATAAMDKLFSIRSDSPTTQDVVIASRFKVGYLVSGSGDTQTISVLSGTEIPAMWQYVITTQRGGLLKGRVDTFAEFTSTSTASDLLEFLNTMAIKEQFDWSPLTTVILPDGVQVMGDVHNVTNLTPKQIELLNRVCLYSEFNAFGM